MTEAEAKTIGLIVRHLSARGHNDWRGGDIERAEELTAMLGRAGFRIVPTRSPGKHYG